MQFPIPVLVQGESFFSGQTGPAYAQVSREEGGHFRYTSIIKSKVTAIATFPLFWRKSVNKNGLVLTR
jgi:hypothetical protein